MTSVSDVSGLISLSYLGELETLNNTTDSSYVIIYYEAD